MSLNSPTIPLSALSSMTVNFDASLSSSQDDSQSLPTTSTCAYVKSPDLLMNKSTKKTDTNDSDENFFPVPQVLELKSQSVSEQSQINTNSGHVEQQEDGPQLPTKADKYMGLAANQTAFDDSINNSATISNTSNRNVVFTISSGSEVSGIGSDATRGNTSNTASATHYQSALEDTYESALAGTESLEVPELSSGQSETFASL